MERGLSGINVWFVSPMSGTALGAGDFDEMVVPT